MTEQLSLSEQWTDLLMTDTYSIFVLKNFFFVIDFIKQSSEMDETRADYTE